MSLNRFVRCLSIAESAPIELAREHLRDLRHLRQAPNLPGPRKQDAVQPRRLDALHHEPLEGVRAAAARNDARVRILHGVELHGGDLDDALEAEEVPRDAILCVRPLGEADAHGVTQRGRVGVGDCVHRRRQAGRINATVPGVVPQDVLSQAARVAAANDLDADLRIAVAVERSIIDVARADEGGLIVDHDHLRVQEDTIEASAWAAQILGHRDGVGDEEEREVVPPVALQTGLCPIVFHGLLEAVGPAEVRVERARFCAQRDYNGHGELLVAPPSALDAVQQHLAHSVRGPAVQHGPAHVPVGALVGGRWEVRRKVLVLDEDEAFGLADHANVLVVGFRHRSRHAHPVPVAGQHHLASLHGGVAGKGLDAVRQPPREEAIAAWQVDDEVLGGAGGVQLAVDRKLQRPRQHPVQRAQAVDADAPGLAGEDGEGVRGDLIQARALHLGHFDQQLVGALRRAPGDDGHAEDPQLSGRGERRALVVFPLAGGERLRDSP
mmetsp:Transcript_92390/g.258168  ORF Transcript_92390/g.258168 Transcript_92390/m.258168 type:complete len:496 (+) Transcript_92390:217-1704(+)